MSEKKDSILQQLATSVALVAAATPVLSTLDANGLLVALGGVLGGSVIENVRARVKALDDAVREKMADSRFNDRFDETVKQDEFLALYVRARDTASKSEKAGKIEYIRNFLVNSVILPTSKEPDKERYLRLIDELTLQEHEHLQAFLRTVIASSGSTRLEDWIVNPRAAGGMISSFAASSLSVPPGTSSAAVNDLTDELVVTFRHLHSAGLLSGIAIGGGDMFQFQSNGFTPKFLRFILAPF